MMKYKKGIKNRLTSNLSNKPPCPGSRLPESFIPEDLFMKDSAKSPIGPKKPIITAGISHLIPGVPKYWLRINPVKSAPTTPPQNPAQDFPGLIRGAIFFLPNFLPTK